MLTSTRQPPLFTMPRAPKCRAQTNLRQCKPKHQATQNEHWLHLSSGETDLQFTLQVALAMILTFIAAMTQQLLLVLAVKAVTDADMWRMTRHMWRMTRHSYLSLPTRL